MKIGILLCGHPQKEVAEKFGGYNDIYLRMLAGHGFDFVEYDVVNMEFPDSVNEADGWLLTGSSYGAYDDAPFIAPMEGFIRDCYAAHVPTVGICFGHQLIAQALGGTVEKFKGGWAIGPTEYHFTSEGNVRLNAWHQDQVITPPISAKTIANNSFCKHAALIYEDRMLTIQAHPEFPNEIVSEYVKLRRHLPEYPDQIMARATDNLALPIDDIRIGNKIAEFFRQPRQD